MDLGRPIREGYLRRLAAQPEVERCEVYLQGFAYWAKPDGGTELCMVIGSRLADDSLGAVDELTPELRAQADRAGRHRHRRVGPGPAGRQRRRRHGRGDRPARPRGRLHHGAEEPGRAVRLLLAQHGPAAAAAAARTRSTYVLAQVPATRRTPRRWCDRLREQYHEHVGVHQPTSSRCRSQLHWLTKTKAGIALGYAAALGLLVGAVVTSQTLYAATAASLREYAVLRALGIPRWRMAVMVMAQSFWVGIIGIGLALPAVYGLAQLADRLAVQVLLPLVAAGGAAAVTLVMALVSGLMALRSLRQVEPATLLR